MITYLWLFLLMLIVFFAGAVFGAIAWKKHEAVEAKFSEWEGRQ